MRVGSRVSSCNSKGYIDTIICPPQMPHSPTLFPRKLLILRDLQSKVSNGHRSCAVQCRSSIFVAKIWLYSEYSLKWGIWDSENTLKSQMNLFPPLFCYQNVNSLTAFHALPQKEAFLPLLTFALVMRKGLSRDWSCFLVALDVFFCFISRHVHLFILYGIAKCSMVPKIQRNNILNTRAVNYFKKHTYEWWRKLGI